MGRKEELQALMRDRSLTREERAARINEVKAKYAAAEATKEAAAPPAPAFDANAVKEMQIPSFRRSAPTTAAQQSASCDANRARPSSSKAQTSTSYGGQRSTSGYEANRARPSSSSSKPSSVKDRMAAFSNNSFVPNYDPVAFAVSKNKAHSFKTQQAAKQSAQQSNMRYSYNYGDGGVVDKTQSDVKAMGDNRKAAQRESKDAASRYDYRYTG
ncbi:hypothetical protein ACHAXT_005923 [Thalassiosira profunda]